MVTDTGHGDPHGSWMFVRRSALPTKLCPRPLAGGFGQFAGLLASASRLAVGVAYDAPTGDPDVNDPSWSEA